MRKKWLLWMCIAVLQLVLFHHFTYAESPELALEVVPSSITLAPGEGADVTILIRNPSPDLLQQLNMSCFTEAGMTASCEAVTPATLQANSSMAWHTTISRTLDGPKTSKVHFQLSYVRQQAETSQTMQDVQVAAVEIQERPTTPIAEIAAVSVNSTLETLQEGQIGLVFLVVTNCSDIPVTIKAPEIEKPDFITNEVEPSSTLGISLAPQQSQTFKVEVTVIDTVQTGKHMLLFKVPLEWERSGRKFSGSLIVGHELSVGVLGESEILKLLGVPSFWLLPGFLMLTTFLTLRKHSHSAETSQTNAKSPEFWLFASTFSLIAAYLYPRITGWLPRIAPRNYLQGYGLTDVFYVWIGSVGVGFILWALLYGGKKLLLSLWGCIKKGKSRIEKIRKMPSTRDKPIKTLNKLSRSDEPWPLKEAEVHINDSVKRCFILRDSQDDKWLWVAPIVQWKWIAANNETAREEFDTKLAEIDDSDDPQDLARLFEKAKKKAWIEIKWKKARWFQHPLRVEKTHVTILQNPYQRRCFEEK